MSMGEDAPEGASNVRALSPDYYDGKAHKVNERGSSV